MSRQRNPAKAWDSDGRTVVPLDVARIPRPKHFGAGDPSWWTPERRERQRESGRLGKEAQMARRRALPAYEPATGSNCRSVKPPSER